MDTFDFAEFAQKMAANMKNRSLNKVEENIHGLHDLVESIGMVKWELVGSEDVKKSFCFDMKELLKIEDGSEFLQAFFDIENNLNKIRENLNIDEIEIPSFDEFYKNLSPILLKGMWESYQNDISAENKLKSIFEAMRINLEDDLYYWQK